MLLTVLVYMKLPGFSENSGEVPEPLYTILSQDYDYPEPFVFLIYTLAGIVAVKLVAKITPQSGESSYSFFSGIGFWIICCVTIAAMQGTALYYYAEI